MRFNLCPYLVSFSPDYEKSLLYYLSDLQLGSSDDVFAADFYGRLLCDLFGGSVGRCMAGVGTMRYDVSGTILGSFQCGAAVFGVYR